jgi:hypothetical protein
MAMSLGVARAESVGAPSYATVYFSVENRTASQAVFGVAWERIAGSSTGWTRVLAPSETAWLGGVNLDWPGTPPIRLAYPTFVVSGADVACEPISVYEGADVGVTLDLGDAGYRCVIAPREGGDGQ